MSFNLIQIWDYSQSLLAEIPYEVFERLVSILCLCSVVFVVWKGLRTGLRYVSALFLIEFFFSIILLDGNL